MSNWTTEQQNTKTFLVKDGYLEYYTDTKSYAGRLEPGTMLSAKYQTDADVLKITVCSSSAKAKGKYLISPYNEDGDLVLYTTSESTTTTEAKTTVDEDTGKVTPETTDSDGETSGSETYIDDSFIDEYEITYGSEQDYADNLQEGLRIADLRGILGAPHQFLSITDPRINIDDDYIPGSDDDFGRVYSEKIIKQIPLLLMTPGDPTFMAGFNTDQKNAILGKLIGVINSDQFNSIFTDDKSGKYYSLKYNYTEYFHYVNAMLRSAAYFLEIQDETIDGKKLGTMNWLYQSSTLGQKSIYSHGKLSNFLGPYAGCIAFYADAGTTVDESFGNATTESQLASGLNSLSEQAREMNFIVGSGGAALGYNLDAYLGSDAVSGKVSTLTDTVDDILGSKGNVLSNILGKATTLLSGGRLVFPEIWSDSTFSRSYSCSMKLVSPSGDKLSVFLNILVPIYHLLGFTLPRATDVSQTYYTPFLVRAYYKGLFNVDMGIISGLSITKGDEGEWTTDGIPTVANVNFEIKDLYDALYMSKQTDEEDTGIMSNIQELDYIANSCGININDQEVYRTIKMYLSLGFTGEVTDRITIDIFGKVTQYFNQKMQNIFGMFK